jgi:hypothetical protein
VAGGRSGRVYIADKGAEPRSSLSAAAAAAATQHRWTPSIGSSPPPGGVVGHWGAAWMARRGEGRIHGRLAGLCRRLCRGLPCFSYLKEEAVALAHAGTSF